MASTGKFKCKGIKELQKRVQEFDDNQKTIFINELARELAARLLSKAIKATPVGDYDDGRMGGTLRRGWTAGQAAASYANSLTVIRSGNKYIVEVTNPVEYAPYVEFGHKTKSGGFVEGRYMLTIAEQDVKAEAPAIISNKLRRELGALFND